MALVTHVAAHPDQLVALLCDGLAERGDDPFARGVVAVPTRGIERWLTQRIADGLAARGAGDGICANVDFPFPWRVVETVLLAVPELTASVAAWEGPALTAHLLEAIDAHRAEPWLRLVGRHVEGDERGNRLAAAVKLSHLFAGYARRRPAMVRAWKEGSDEGPDGSPMVGREWQPRLWRVVRARIGEPSLPELLPQALEPVRDGSVALDLPERLAVYGLTTADPLDLQVLVALGRLRRVDLYLLHPSPALWHRAAALPVTAELPRRTADPSAGLAVHPLLGSWAHDSRELQQVLAGHGLVADPVTAPERPATVLGTLQADVLADRRPGKIACADRSVQVHACHGPRRQVEVMRDAVLHVLAADPTLEPRDIVIMTPDLATFAPLIEAAFPADGGSRDAIPDLRVRIADRSPAATNPLVRFAATVLDLADGRLEAAAVRELVARPVVHHRFGFDADTAGDIDELIADMRVAWGMDAADRERWGAGTDPSRTWGRGLDRALAGMFYSDSPVRVVGDTAPFDGVEGTEARPAGLLAAILDRIAAVRARFAAAVPMSQWAAALADAVRMLAAPGWDEEWQWGQLERLLAEAFPATPGADPGVSVAEARRLLARWLDDRPSPLHFRTGDVTVCTMPPMRSVPYRVVCLLGMDHDRFPRTSRGDGDDLLLDDERVGDRDRGAEDRQLLLDAVMAAGDTLIITYSARDELTSAEYPPAVPVSELLDVVAAMLGTAELDGTVVVHHPLQSFSARNFESGALIPDRPWGFDPVQHAGAQALHRRSTVPDPGLAWPDFPEDDPVTLADLVRFLQHPVERFLTSRVGVSVPRQSEVADDNLSADLNALERWAVTDRLLAGLIAGRDIEELARRQRSGDLLPPGHLGDDDLDGAVATAGELWEAAQARGHDPGAHRPVTGVVAAGGRTVEGSVLADPGPEHLCTVTASRVRGRHRIRAYAEMVFATAVDPAVPWKAVLIGKRDGTGNVAVTLGPLAPNGSPEERRDHALVRLGELVELYTEGMRRPLPLPCETGYAWQRAAASSAGKALGAARSTWGGSFGERREPAYTMAAPRWREIEDLRAAGFDDYVGRLWLPVMGVSVEVSA